jgi:1-pyrroline-4-hydroxy-2-carboxylate deaminase
MTTPFDADGSVDHASFVRHARWLAGRGVHGVIVAGSLGEGSSLTAEERVALVDDLVPALPPQVPVIAAVAAARTADAAEQARRAEAAGARGLLVLPPYIYHGDREETNAHFGAVLGATGLPCMLYNNPPAYVTDVGPEQLLELVERHPTLTGVKESSGDVRRITALRALLGERIDIAVGLDDAILEGLHAGATGWVAGLANALPEESVALFVAGCGTDPAEARELYRWFLPLLRMDTGPKFVQEIKLVQAELGLGEARVRAPRLELPARERERVLATLRECLARHPILRRAARGAPTGRAATTTRSR